MFILTVSYLMRFFKYLIVEEVGIKKNLKLNYLFMKDTYVKDALKIAFFFISNLNGTCFNYLCTNVKVSFVHCFTFSSCRKQLKLMPDGIFSLFSQFYVWRKNLSSEIGHWNHKVCCNCQTYFVLAQFFSFFCQACTCV